MPALQTSVSFAALKRSIPIGQVLDRYGLLQRLHRSGDNLNGPCPLHAGHNPEQFRVSLSKNCWFCFGDCQAGGSVLDFVSRKEGIGIRDAALLLQEWFGTLAPSPASIEDGRRRRQPPSEPQRQSNPPLGFCLRLSSEFDAYLAQRGLTEKTIRSFGLGYCNAGLMAGRVAIPIHNSDGRIVAYAGRWPGRPPNGTPRYKLPRGFRKSLELFNLHRALSANPSNPLIVVEGFFGCMAVWQAGFRQVVALMGSSVSEFQAAHIIRAAAPSGRVVLLFDEDNAGRKAREKAYKRLRDALDVRVVSFPAEGLQPDRVSPQTLCALLA